MNNLKNVDLLKRGIPLKLTEKLGIKKDDNENYYFDGEDKDGNKGLIKLEKETGDVKHLGILETTYYSNPFLKLFNQKEKNIVFTDSLLDALTVTHMMKYSKPVYFIPNEAGLMEMIEYFGDKKITVINNKNTYMSDIHKFFKAENIVRAKLPKGKTLNDFFLEKEYSLIQNILEGQNLQDGLNLVDNGSIFTDGLGFEPSLNDFPFPSLTEMLGGVKKNEIIFVVAGSAGGKTDFGFRMLNQYMLDGDKVGMFAMEQKYQHEVLFQMASYRGDFKYDVNEIMEHGSDPQSEVMQKYLTIINDFKDDIAIFDTTKVSLTIENIENYIRNFVRVEGCKHIMIDHITFFAHKAGGKGVDQVGQFVSKIVELSQELGCTFLITTQVHKMGGKGQDAENGVQISAGDIFGSSAIFHAGTLVMALERNSQSQDPEIQNTTTCRILKSRYDPSQMGKTTEFWYDVDTGQKIDKTLKAFYENAKIAKENEDEIPY